jgi:hypothetical protein
MDKENVVPGPGRIASRSSKPDYFGPSAFDKRTPPVSTPTVVNTVQPTLRVDLSKPEDFIRLVSEHHSAGGVLALVWNMDVITVIATERTLVIRFVPELEAKAKAYLAGESVRVLTLKSFFEFVLEVAAETSLEPDVPAMVSAALNTGLNPEQAYREAEEFEWTMSVCGAYKATLHIRTEVQPPFSSGSQPEPRTVTLRCVNAEATRLALISETMDRLPKEIPRYHGRVTVGDKNVDN